jgi:transposase-like protein
MPERRQIRNEAFKAKVALEAIKGLRTVNQIAGEYGVHPTQVGQWKKLLLSQAPSLFGRGKSRSEAADAELQDELYRQIGRLKMELEWLKKKCGLDG